jgi:coenzyme PQQ precursor peptide PqqA
MVWETPSFVEIDMSAEIGAYQGDFTPEFATPEPTDAEIEGAA